MTTSEAKPSYVARYEERHNLFRLHTFRVPGDVSMTTGEHLDLERTLDGPIEDRPEWLTAIVNLAKLGGWAMSPPSPPPNFIFWFNLDAEGNLLEFVRFADTPQP